MDAKGVANLIHNAESIGTVVVRAPNGRADLVSSMVRKERPESRVGVTLKQRGRKVVIARIAEDELFAHTLLNVGDTCLSINGMNITPNVDARTAVDLILTSPDFVTIEAKIARETGVVVAASEESRARIGSAATWAQNSVSRTVCIFFVMFAFIIIIIVGQKFSRSKLY